MELPLDQRKRKRQFDGIEQIQKGHATNDFVMQTASEQGGNRWKRRVAAFAVAILLLAQSLGAAHFHPLPTQQKYAPDAVVNADDGLCAICVFRIHSPTVSAVAPYLTAPVLFDRIVVFATQSRLCSACYSHLFGRAPPASV